MDKAIEKEGLIQILRHGFNINKIHFNIFGNLPSSKNSEKQNKLYESNVFTCIQEFHYTRSEQYKKNRIDLVLFINGFPLITVELKKSNQQSVYEAIEQYKTTRQPDERFFKQNYRSVVYFAMSDTDVFFTTKLDNEKTKFLPFNKGNDSHGGNPIVPGKYPTHYM
jgi:type I restriction enzyme R subunit